ncbi:MULTISPECIES: hypothetical protein [unclassified Haladaptatus]|uniref:hypothetical protein n=1 Tax=unclassified Haladaptatus TaxID=2622732 RepID=UPI002FCE024B
MSYTWQYYDLVLVGIALAMSLGVGVGVLTTMALTTSVTLAGLAAIGIMGHALFVNGPVSEPSDLTDEVQTLN